LAELRTSKRTLGQKAPVTEIDDISEPQEAPSDIEERLLPIVEELLYEHGYHGLNIREIAKRIGMGPATIYKYFGSKEGLALRVLQEQDIRLACAITRRIPVDGSAEAKWRALYRALLAYYDKSISTAVIQNVAMPTATWFLSEEKWPVSAVANLLKELIREGRASGELDPAVSDNQIMAIHYMHLVREVRLWQSRAMSWRLADRIDRFFPIIWKTISAPAGYVKPKASK
jgi:AcrR family transcriptional regulator